MLSPGAPHSHQHTPVAPPSLRRAEAGEAGGGGGGGGAGGGSLAAMFEPPREMLFQVGRLLRLHVLLPSFVWF